MREHHIAKVAVPRVFPGYWQCARYEPLKPTPKSYDFAPWDDKSIDKSMQSYSGELEIVPEPNTFITLSILFLSPDFVAFSSFQRFQ